MSKNMIIQLGTSILWHSKQTLKDKKLSIKDLASSYYSE